MTYQGLLDEAMRTINRCDATDVEVFVTMCAVDIPRCLRHFNIDATTPPADLRHYLSQPFMNVMAKVGRSKIRVDLPPLSAPLDGLYSRFAGACRESDTTLATRLGEAAADALVADDVRRRAPVQVVQAWPAGAVLMAYFHALASPVRADELVALARTFWNCYEFAERMARSEQ